MASNNIFWAAPKELSFEGNISENYRKLEEHWMLFEKTELKGRTGEERCSYFLLLIGEKGREIHKTLTFAEPETETGEDGRPVWKRSTEQLRKAFREYCSPQKNVTYERHKFNIRNQTENESIDPAIRNRVADSCLNMRV